MDSPAKTIRIVTFNGNERAAVEHLFNRIDIPGSTWGRSDTGLVSSPSQRIRIDHRPVGAQGNVVGAIEVVDLLRDLQPSDVTLFYGCAGAVEDEDLGCAFIVQTAHYASLGSVLSGADGAERATLKPKWIAATEPQTEGPLEPLYFPLATGSGAIDVPVLSSLPVAHVVATDKVINVPPSVPPRANAPTSRGPVYPKTERGAPREWTYGEALGHYQNVLSEPLLIDMESYGIGRAAAASDILAQTLIIRVATDALANKRGTNDQQGRMLLDRVGDLAAVLSVLIDHWRHPE